MLMGGGVWRWEGDVCMYVGMDVCMDEWMLVCMYVCMDKGPDWSAEWLAWFIRRWRWSRGCGYMRTCAMGGRWSVGVEWKGRGGVVVRCFRPSICLRRVGRRGGGRMSGGRGKADGEAWRWRRFERAENCGSQPGVCVGGWGMYVGTALFHLDMYGGAC